MVSKLIFIIIGIILVGSLGIRLGVVGRNNKWLVTSATITSMIGLINTLIHELWHLFSSVLTGGDAYKIHLHSNRSGVAMTGSRSWFSSVIVKLAGYTGASITAYVFALAMSKGMYSILLWVILGLLVVSTVFYIRNRFGLIWGIGLTLLTVWLLISGDEVATTFVLTVVCAILLFESFVSTIDLLVISVITPHEPSDASDLRDLTKIPTLIWAFGFLVVAFYCMIGGIRVLFDGV